VLWGVNGVTAESWLEAPGAKRAADTLHSWMVDEFFPPNVSASFETAAKALGFQTIDRHFSQSEGGMERDEFARALFESVCAAPVTEGDKHRGRGWVVAGVDLEDWPVGIALRGLLNQADEASTTPEALAKALEPLYGRWQRILNLREPAVVEFRKERQRLFVRFKTDTSEAEYRVNDALRKP
jgi:hypothetical protein